MSVNLQSRIAIIIVILTRGCAAMPQVRS